MNKNNISFLIAFLVPFYLIRVAIFNIPTTIFEIAVYFFLAVILTKYQKDVSSSLRRIPVYARIGLVLFIVGSVIGAFISPDKVSALGQLKGYIITPVLAAFILGSLNQPRYVVAGLISSGVLVALSGIVDYFIRFDRVIGVYLLDLGASPNYLAMFLAPIAILTITVFLNKKYKFNKNVILVAYVLMVIAIILSGSRAALAVIMLFSILVFVKDLFHKNIVSKNIYKVIVVSSIVLSVAAAIFFGMPNLSAGPDSGRIATSNNIRSEIWGVTIKEVIPQNLILGVGLGNFQNYFNDLTDTRVNYPEFISPRALTPHNLLLAVWVNSGLIGLIGLIILVIDCLRHYFKRYFPAMIIAAILLIGLVDVPFYKNDLSTLFFIFTLSFLMFDKIKTKES